MNLPPYTSVSRGVFRVGYTYSKVSFEEDGGKDEHKVEEEEEAGLELAIHSMKAESGTARPQSSKQI